MLNRDYILRMIEQMGVVLIALRNAILGRGLSADQVQDQLREVAGKVGFDLDLARAATPETIQLLIAPMGEMEPGRAWMVAEVLFLDALQAEIEGRAEEARDGYEKALPLYKLLEPGALHLELPEAAERVKSVESALWRIEKGEPPPVLEDPIDAPESPDE